MRNTAIERGAVDCSIDLIAKERSTHLRERSIALYGHKQWVLNYLHSVLVENASWWQLHHWCVLLEVCKTE